MYLFTKEIVYLLIIILYKKLQKNKKKKKKKDAYINKINYFIITNENLK